MKTMTKRSVATSKQQVCIKYQQQLEIICAKYNICWLQSRPKLFIIKLFIKRITIEFTNNSVFYKMFNKFIVSNLYLIYGTARQLKLSISARSKLFTFKINMN